MLCYTQTPYRPAMLKYDPMVLKDAFASLVPTLRCAQKFFYDASRQVGSPRKISSSVMVVMLTQGLEGRLV